MRISDWSSDVCSSDLLPGDRDPAPAGLLRPRGGEDLSMTASLRSLAPFFAFVAAYALLSPLVENSYYQLMLTLVLVWACFGLLPFMGRVIAAVDRTSTRMNSSH